MQLETHNQNLNVPNLSAYTDYREYLKNFYEYKKQTQSSAVRSYSYATFSAAADIKSPNYLKLIIEGQRNLSPMMIKKFSRALGLSKEEEREFAALVQYSQAKDPLERNRFLKNLAEIRVQHQVKDGEIKAEVMEKVPNWVTWVLYAMADQKNVDFRIPNLRESLKGRASVDEIRRALVSLLSSGELMQTPEGEIKKGRRLMQGSQDVPPALIRKLQTELIYLGLESLFQDDPKNREFGAFTMALTKAEFEQVKFELRQLRKRLFKEFSVKREQTQGDQVYQLNFQLFPVTKKLKKEK